MNSLKVAGKLKLAQHSTCGLKNAKQSRTMIFLSLIARVLQLQLRMSLACAARAYSWLIFNFFSTSTPRSFSAKLSSLFPALQSGLVSWDSFPQDAKLCISFYLVNEVPVSPFIQHVKIPLDTCSNTTQHIYFSPCFAQSVNSIPSSRLYVLYLYICIIHTYCYNVGIYIFNILALVNSQQN